MDIGLFLSDFAPVDQGLHVRMVHRAFDELGTVVVVEP